MTVFNPDARVQLVLGTQWGDEGKGKIVDLLGEQHDVVARFQGGPNAGHTVQIEGEQFILHHIPSGILHDHTICVIGNGMVVDPETILTEIEELEDRGFEVCGRLLISENAHLILPYHKIIDKASEGFKEDAKIGTTGCGIGPAYADKIRREGFRAGDLLTRDWEARLREKVRINNLVLERVYGEPPVDAEDVIGLLLRFMDRLSASIADTMHYMQACLREKKRILLEGAQGTLLDIDFGTYPFVTSSNTTIGGVSTGLGIAPQRIDHTLGILKAYTTRVGNGPFPTELAGDFGDRLREMGGEYGATTGRPRRCGWLDLVAAKYAVQLNGVDSLCITKLDVLDTLDEIRICTAYDVQGDRTGEFPVSGEKLESVRPVYETVPGWKTRISSLTAYGDLPDAARAYLDRISDLLGIPVRIVSVGAGREQTIIL
ncbi:MAG TPA: adenylosuccinate synthase [bacterium]|nr:adenylosuccinate synthase [bacterium]